MKKTSRTALAAIAGTTMVLGGGMALSSPAHAASRNGSCDSGDFCYYFDSNQKGSVSDFTSSLDDYGTTQPTCYQFKGAGTGKGRCVKNNAASVWNRSGHTVRVYFNSNYAGAYQDFKPGTKGNLKPGLKNNDASHQFLRSTPPVTGCKTDGTDTKLPSSILVYRTGSGRVERVAFKTYVKNVLPNEWVSSWHSASLKSGAIAVKSFGWYFALHSESKTPSGHCYDVRDDTGSQVYRPGSATAATNSAVDATWGTRMTRSGKILQAHYCSSPSVCSAWVAGDWMSQNGSQSLAAKGDSYSSILRHYYRDIALTS
ncbi:SpoIID/LytB domain-containing protein [Allobranchiibius huperziae]|uniref:Sporulation stage II protein D amidase enhancer LytB N-terminal domain-containing protein n=1 Tax=Allobranchiibius huperziae TaxID=1874116 RepID=A0A853DHV0_9MICO|nr:SpoIID/LytB domain-containing protein [Allobranchiibius huperziae]NYJ76257.1 hypothetical protein [Allobranchiibius huperziae]